MNSGKSLQLLAVAHNYEEQGKNVLILKPTTDTRSVKGKIESRVGINHEAIEINKESNLFQIVYKLTADINYECILVDEAQFLTKPQVKDLADIVDLLEIPVIAYGLKNSYVDGELFEGSQALLYYADKIEEIKTVCTFCNKKAIMNLRIVNGKPIYEGDSVHVGDIKNGEDYYIPVCRNHYFQPELKQI
jgi:thymidine kinase